MTRINDVLVARLTALRAEGLYRELRRVDSPAAAHVQCDGRTLLNFASNDYLGFAQHPALLEAAQRAVRDFGAGSGASRLICGSLAHHHELEAALAGFKDVEAVLTFSSGYAAALGTIPALVGSDDVVVIDKRVHACLVDAARLSGATLRVFPHNDLDRLADILQWADRRGSDATPRRPADAPRPHVLVMTESVFSMDGDRAPLAELVELKDRHGAWLMVDEAHATGLYGTQRRGLAEAAGVAARIDVHMGTLGKALGAAGGFIAGSRVLIDYLINRARSFIFSTAPVPAAAAAATAGVRLLETSEGKARCAALWERVDQFHRALTPPPLDRSSTAANRSAIVPLLIGGETEAVNIAARLREAGFFVPAVRFPTVPRRTARLRVTLTATHTAAEVSALVARLHDLGLPHPTSSPPHASTGPA